MFLKCTGNMIWKIVQPREAGPGDSGEERKMRTIFFFFYCVSQRYEWKRSVNGIEDIL